MGRLIPVCQSNVVAKSPGKNRATVTESAGLTRPGARNVSAWRWVVVRSTKATEFCQLKLPNRNGVARVNEVFRELPTWGTVSITPFGWVIRRLVSGVPAVRSLVRLRLGDQVTFRPMSIGFGESVSAGSSVDELPSDRLCLRLPPTLSRPQRKRFWKLRLLFTCWVFWSGLSAFWRTTTELLT